MFVIALVRKDMDVNDRKDHPTLHLDTNYGIEIACSNKNYGFK
jgi:hypothetical protein